MDIKDIKRAMDNMPMGDGSAFAEISVGPAKHEQFLDEHYGKVALVVLLCVLGAAGWIIYNGVQDSMERKAGAALVAAMPESPATGEISLDEQGLQQVVADFDSSRAAGRVVPFRGGCGRSYFFRFCHHVPGGHCPG